MKRRANDGAKLRRPVKRTKIADGFYSTALLYLKFLLVWATVIFADFLLEFRFEFLWPFWMLLRSVYDSFKYQGLAFSMFFVCIALTSDVICFFFVPVQWVFFAASTYVWVQYVWYTEKGVCLPTVVLCSVFVYMEAGVRLRDMRHAPAHLDLCRPFAAHCIGYPVVTLGFGFKSYIGYRLRKRRQQEVAKENGFYMQLLQQALPPAEEGPTPLKELDEKTPERHMNGNAVHLNPNCKGRKSETRTNHVAQPQQVDPAPPERPPPPAPPNRDPPKTPSQTQTRHSHSNGSVVHNQTGDRTGGEHSDRNVETSSVSQERDVEPKTNHTAEPVTSETSEKTGKGSKGNSRSDKRESTVTNQREERRKNKKEKEVKEREYMENAQKQSDHNKESEASARAANERALRAALAAERQARAEITQLRQQNEQLTTKLNTTNSSRQADRAALATAERRLAEERRARQAADARLRGMHKSGECAWEWCRQRRVALEQENNNVLEELQQLREHNQSLTQSLQAAEQQVNALEARSRDSGADTWHVVKSLRDRIVHLEHSLSAETRVKLDLFSAVGETKRQLDLRDDLIRTQEKEIDELKAKIAQVLAVMPNDPFSPGPAMGISKMRLSDVGCYPSHMAPHHTVGNSMTNAHAMGNNANANNTNNNMSNLDPNATAYTPKGTLVQCGSPTEA